MKAAHPGCKAGIFLHFFFCHITGGTPASAVCEQYIEIASVIADKENRFIGDIFFADHGCPDSGHPENDFKRPLHDAQGTYIARMGG